MAISAGPPKRGHQAAKNFLDPVYVLLLLQWNHMTALSFCIFVFWILNGHSFIYHVLCLRSCWVVYCTQIIYHVSCLMSQVLLNGLLYRKKQRIALKPLGAQDLGWPQNHHENSSIFEPVSKATKAMKSSPKATQNHEKSTLESQEIQFLRKLIFAIPSMPNACFSNPRHPNLDPKTNRKSNLEIDMKKTVSFVQNYQKSSQNGSPKSTKNR